MRPTPHTPCLHAPFGPRGTRIEDYALLGDMRSAALVGRDGSVDWLCLPRFDSPAVFTSLLGTAEHGFWRIGPVHTETPPAATRRAYRSDTLVLDTGWNTLQGSVRVTDFMPPHSPTPQLLRTVTGLSGQVPMWSVLRPRPGYGAADPDFREEGDRTVAATGEGGSLWIDAPPPSELHDATLHTAFTIEAGQELTFAITWAPDGSGEPALPRPAPALETPPRSGVNRPAAPPTKAPTARPWSAR
ncbi:trehalase-like domain-containing protein [Streptomyces uncialis]|uniref:trehalase-like domain-containing protein n=1 Tax=Streptomyces uncialis TaxID=1048205 RepID=UPI003823BA28